MRQAPDGTPATPMLADALAHDAVTLAPHGAHLAVLHAKNLCAAVYDADDRLIFSTIGWQAAALLPDPKALRGVAAGLPQVMESGDLAPLLMWASAASARSWALPDDVLAALAAPHAAMLVLAVLPMAAADILQAASRALGLTGVQGRVLASVLKTGSIRTAAAACGIACGTARDAVSGAMARVGVPKLPALLNRLTLLALGIWPEDDDADQGALLADMLGLTPRQAQLALALALGQTRAEAAAAVGVSDAVAKKEIDHIYFVTGVGSAPALVRRLAEARALAMLSDVAGSAPGGVVWADEGVVPLRFVERADGSRIAISDHGPAGAPRPANWSRCQSRLRCTSHHCDSDL
jgi:DNA-binding CsgD family transcriptional regulator